MSDAPSVTVDFRIPGNWAHPRDLVERMPEGYELTAEHLVLPDGSKMDFTPMPADEQFSQIFRQALRQPASDAELAIVDSYTTNLLLSGEGGSMEAALRAMEGAAALVRAGAAGVFIDNCALAHGGEDWLIMTEDGSSDAISFAFVTIIRGKQEAFTVGMHVLGLRDIVMQRWDIEHEGFDIVEVIRYLSRGDKPIEDGHIIADLEGPRFQVRAEPAPQSRARAMNNPFGRFRLVSYKDIAGAN